MGEKGEGRREKGGKGVFAYSNEVPLLRLKAWGKLGLDVMEKLIDGLWLRRHYHLVYGRDRSLLGRLIVG